MWTENTLAAACRASRAAWQYEVNLLCLGSEALIAQNPEHPYVTVWSRVWRLWAATHRLGGGPHCRAGLAMTGILWAEPARVRQQKYYASGSKHSVQWMPIMLLQAASLQSHY